MSERFWLVWNPAGRTPPSYRHPTEESAVAEAGRLAELEPGASFFVLGAVGFASADKPVARYMSFDFDETEFNDPPGGADGYLPLRTARESPRAAGKFEVGDLVRNKAGVEGVVVPNKFALSSWIAVSFPGRPGSFAHSPRDLTLTRPVQAGG